MRRFVLVAIAVLIGSVPINGQNDCGNGLPCGPVPWPLPDLPILVSPSPYPTVVYQATDTPVPIITDTPVPTEAPTNTIAPTVTLPATQIGDQIGTLQAVIEATEPVVSGADFDNLGGDAGEFIGYVRGVAEIDLGFLNQLITLAIVGLGYVISVKVLQFSAPIIAVFVGVIRKIIQFVLGFIPGFG